jgi:uncharacterized membrane protein YhdT
MKDRRGLIAKVFSYGFMTFQAAFFLTVLPRFISSGNWGATLLMVGFFIAITIMIFVYPNFTKVILGVPFRWGAAAVLTLSLIFTGVSLARLPIIFQGLAAEPSDYVAVFGSVLFALANIVAILLTARAHRGSEAKKDIHPEA